MKKKLLALLMTAALACSFAGCGAKEEGLSDEYITISQVEGLKVEKIEEVNITDKMIDDTVQSILFQNTDRTEVTDRAAKDGDTVIIDFKGFVDGVEFEGGAAQGAELELGSGKFIGATKDYKGFEEQIVGHKAGDEFEIETQFPADYRQEDLRNAVAVFKIKLNEIFLDVEPELTDEFVQSISTTLKTVEEFKKEIKQDMEKSYESQAESQLAEKVMRALFDKIEVKKFPEGVVEEKIQSTEDYYHEMADESEMEYDDYCNQFLGVSGDELKESIKGYAEEEVKFELACKLIAKEKELEPTEEEFKEEIAKYAEGAGLGTTSEFLEVVGEDNVKNVIRQEIVLRYLMDSCVQK